MAYIDPDTGESLEYWEAEGLAERQLNVIYGMAMIAGYSYDTAYALRIVDPDAYQEMIDGLITALDRHEYTGDLETGLGITVERI